MAFFTAGVQFITFRSDIVPYGHSNIRVLDDSVDGVINETFTCLITFGIGEFAWNTTIVQPRKFKIGNVVSIEVQKDVNSVCTSIVSPVSELHVSLEQVWSIIED